LYYWIIGSGIAGAIPGSGYDITTGSYNVILGNYRGNAGGIDLRTADNNIILSDGAANVRMWCNASGRFLIGGTTVVDSAYLSINYDSANYIGIGIKQTSNGTGTNMNFWNSVNANVGSITSTSSATSFNTSSDYRLKENIVPMTGALATVTQLKPVTYKWKLDGSDGQGFIAHELAEVMPDCVTGEKDAVDKNGNPVYQGMDTSFLVATLVSAIQELKAEFDAYKATHP